MTVDVLLPLPLSGLFSYHLPDSIGENNPIGRRVLVPFGKKKIYTGIVWTKDEGQRIKDEGQKTKDTEHAIIEIKDILCFLDDAPIITATQMQLWEWIASYYMCTLGEVMKAALPTALKLESETRVQRMPDFVASHPLTATQDRLLDLLTDNKPKNIDEIGKRLGIANVMPALNKLLQMGAIQLEEAVRDKYQPKTEKYLRLASAFAEPELQLIIDSLRRAQQQQKCLLTFLGKLSENTPEIAYSTFIAETGFSSAIVRQLVDKSILTIEEKPISRLTAYASSHTSQPSNLTIQQQTAVANINTQWQTKDVVLLHGVTSSGKTEVYIHLIEQAIAQGQQVLYLVPEIALTTQLTDRLHRVFGNRLAVYHSRFSDAERVEIYRAIIEEKKYDVVLGTRSALLLPFSRLGLVIIDEEHDASYKQQDPAPRYHARNAAIVLAQKAHAKVLLGTATPAIETYFNTQCGKYGLVEMTERYAGLALPKIVIVDSKQQYRRKEMSGHFSDILTQRITEQMAKNKQTIIFQNRRGYAHYLECPQCGYVPKCVNCDVSLTVHERQGILSCHYCGYSTPLVQTCPVCHAIHLSDKGFGTEKVEDELQTLFPTARIARMDLDTTRNKHAHQRLINAFAAHEIDMLVGTQMVSKGLHFDDVSTVAVLNADNLMNKPDFRAYEQAFQMLEQVSGRAGRKGEQGEVIIQTFQADNPIFRFLVEHDYKAFYHLQIAERKAFHYPPFNRLISLTIRMRDAHLIDAVSTQLQAQLVHTFAHRCSRVITPSISRVQNLYVRQILLKIEANAPYQKAKDLLQEQINWLHTTPDGKGAQVIVDIDPM